MSHEDPFEEPTGELPEHYASIGRLITSFSNIERALTVVLREVLGLSDQTARAVTGEMRAGELTASLTRVINAQMNDPPYVLGFDGIMLPPPSFPDNGILESLFGEIHRLKIIRDDIAHRRFFVRRREMFFTNMDTFRTPAASSYNIYSIEDLNTLAAYAERLETRVNGLLYPPRKPSNIPAEAWARSQAALHEIPPQLKTKDRSRAGKGKAPR